MAPGIRRGLQSPFMADTESQSSETDERFARVYAELRQVARQQMARERGSHTLQPTALVHEAWLRLEKAGIDPSRVDKAAFFYNAARVMREILIDHARTRGRQKRGGDRRRIGLSRLDLVAEQDPQSLLAIDEAICRLEEVDARAAAVVRLRFFAGLEVAQVAEVLGRSVRTVMREWAWARAWLYDELKDGETERA